MNQILIFLWSIEKYLSIIEKYLSYISQIFLCLSSYFNNDFIYHVMQIYFLILLTFYTSIMGFIRGGGRIFHTYMIINTFCYFCFFNKGVGLLHVLLIPFILFIDRIFPHHHRNIGSNNQYIIEYGKKKVKGNLNSSSILQHHAIFIVDQTNNNNIYKIHIVGDKYSRAGVIFKIEQIDDYSDYQCSFIGYSDTNIYEELQDKDEMILKNKSRFTCHDFAWYIVETYSNGSHRMLPVNLLLFGCFRWQHYFILLSIFLVVIDALHGLYASIFVILFKFYECYLYYDIQCALNHDNYIIKDFMKYLFNITDDELKNLKDFIYSMKYSSLDTELRKKLWNTFISMCYWIVIIFDVYWCTYLLTL
jgi:hypothetical protein